MAKSMRAAFSSVCALRSVFPGYLAAISAKHRFSTCEAAFHGSFSSTVKQRVLISNFVSGQEQELETKRVLQIPDNGRL